MTLISVKIPSSDTRITFRPGGIGQDPFLSRILFDGNPTYEFGNPCGTCGVTFDKVTDVDFRLDDELAASLLGTLNRLPADVDLLRLGRVLQSGKWDVGVFEGIPRLIEPGAEGDFFVEEVTPLHGSGQNDQGRPRTSYYRFGMDTTIAKRFNFESAPVLRASLIAPMQNPAAADEGRVQHWLTQHEAGHQLTALAVGIVDFQGPAFWDAIDAGCAYREHQVLTHYLLDGHHRVLAGARAGAPVRILSFIGPPRGGGELDQEARELLESLSMQSSLRPE
ncbi:MAG: hypothetical protein JWM25_1988 [Thermoleophilia bacterium]|nr:hypothetical protein [Thermoleophilia bacterium]